MEKLVTSDTYISPEVQKTMEDFNLDPSVDWVGDWIHILDEDKTEWVHWGHEQETGSPGIVKIIEWNGDIVNTPTWERLSSDDDLRWCLTSEDSYTSAN
jgi:hypothetical protein